MEQVLGIRQADLIQKIREKWLEAGIQKKIVKNKRGKRAKIPINFTIGSSNAHTHVEACKRKHINADKHNAVFC